MKNSMGTRLRHLMKLHNLNVADLATNTGLSEVSVKNMMYDRSNGIDRFQKIASFCKIPMDYFLKEEELDLDNSSLDPAYIEKFFDISISIIKEKNIESMSGQWFINMMKSSYSLLSSGQLTEKDLAVYIRGQVDTALSLNAVTKKLPELVD